MKNIIPFLLLFSVNFLFSQTTRVYYQFTYKPNKTDTLKQTELQVLLFNNERSSFQSYKQLQRDSLISVSLEYKNKSGEFSHNDQNFTKSIINQYIIETNIKEKSLQFTDILGNQISASYQENINLKWNLENEKMDILNIPCQKAYTNFGGRKWTAWFASDYHSSFGPYKFFGLPGLILKLYDSEKNFDWEVYGIKNYHDSQLYEKNYFELQAFPTTKIEKNKFLKMEQQFKEHPMGNVKESFPDLSGEMLKDILEREKKEIEKNNYYNNPIEI
ncbi:GLPGLI family protein [Chryseobacterium salivictor]|uniref:GLPGLI family protein n=1 Tax=Chryseobacterium salivictor TaxID=2547600 RepID=A0A4P6ZGX1_9FLAO|nr:GLPGLI family protein [Chryseobacterium salivictor]QBO59016.1 hypothetical protein NBC122_02210 [Chryseobacterium salivictor]